MQMPGVLLSAELFLYNYNVLVKLKCTTHKSIHEQIKYITLTFNIELLQVFQLML